MSMLVKALNSNYYTYYTLDARDIARVASRDISDTAMATFNDLAAEACTDISKRVLYYLFVAALDEALHKSN